MVRRVARRATPAAVEVGQSRDGDRREDGVERVLVLLLDEVHLGDEPLGAVDAGEDDEGVAGAALEALQQAFEAGDLGVIGRQVGRAVVGEPAALDAVVEQGLCVVSVTDDGHLDARDGEAVSLQERVGVLGRDDIGSVAQRAAVDVAPALEHVDGDRVAVVADGR